MSVLSLNMMAIPGGAGGLGKRLISLTYQVTGCLVVQGLVQTHTYTVGEFDSWRYRNSWNRAAVVTPWTEYTQERGESREWETSVLSNRER
jgi:hypothetical protein